jgi:hypothetical protein
MEICDIRSGVGVEWRRDNASCSRQFLQVGEESEKSRYRHQSRWDDALLTAGAGGGVATRQVLRTFHPTLGLRSQCLPFPPLLEAGGIEHGIILAHVPSSHGTLTCRGFSKLLLSHTSPL